MELKFKADLQQWHGQGSWFFVSLPSDYYQEIRGLRSAPKRGFGSVRVEVNIGKSIWKTSIFPDSKTKTYLLFVKKSVRVAEKIEVGDNVTVGLRLIDV